jgi:hypothetical protein
VASVKQMLANQQNAAQNPGARPPGGSSSMPPKSLKARLLARLEPSSRPAQRLEGEGTVPQAHEPELILRAMGFLKRTFARLPGGERRELIGATQELIGEMEQALGREEDGSRGRPGARNEASPPSNGSCPSTP